MKKHTTAFLLIILLASCSNNDALSNGMNDSDSTNDFSSQQTSFESNDSSKYANIALNNVGKMLPKVFESDDYNKEIRRDSYYIIGNGFYDQETRIMSKNTASVYNYFKNLEINETIENDHTRYGGSLAIYSFGDLQMKFWDNYLFIENNDTPYKGDFYKIIGSSATAEFITDVFYHSFRIDEGQLSIKDESNPLSSDEIRSALLDMKYMPVSDGAAATNEGPLKIVQLNNIDSLYIYNETDFSIFQSDILYSLNDGYSFANFLSL